MPKGIPNKRYTPEFKKKETTETGEDLLAEVQRLMKELGLACRVRILHSDQGWQYQQMLQMKGYPAEHAPKRKLSGQCRDRTLQTGIDQRFGLLRQSQNQETIPNFV